jgi:hypothetical protein
MNEVKMDELVFLVEVAPEGGFTARALGAAIFTEADDRETLKRSILDAVNCHYEPDERPSLVRLHFVPRVAEIGLGLSVEDGVERGGR